MSLSLNLVVIYTQKLDEVKRFYEKLGIRFTPEKHGNGSVHFSASFRNQIVFEIYPGETSTSGIGFETIHFSDLTVAMAKHGLSFFVKMRHVRRCMILRDPDGRRVEILESFSQPHSSIG